jgi:hypothetical protein
MANLIVAVGGTGKSVALVYLRLAKFFGNPDDIIVIDMPFGSEEIDKQLDKEGVNQGNFFPPWPGGNRDISGVKFAEIIGLDSGAVASPVAHALFTKDELNTLVSKGMNARPIVGATIAMRKFWGETQDPQLNDLRARIGQYDDVFVVGSITGGTGSGILPALGRWLTEECKKRVHGVLFLPWISIGAGSGDGPSDAVMQANAHAVLQYLKQIDPRTNQQASGPAPFQDYVVLGLPGDLEAGNNATSANHPLQLAAATYLLYFNVFLTRTPTVRQGPFYLEIIAGGLRASDMRPRGGFSLEQAVNRQHWYKRVLDELASQKPDEAWDVFVPPLVARSLAWRVLRETVRQLALRSEGHSARQKVWDEMRKYFVTDSQEAESRVKQLGTIVSKDPHHLIYDVRMEHLEAQAKGYEARALAAARKLDAVPNLSDDVAWQTAAGKAAEAICFGVFDSLGKLGSESITGGAAGGDVRQGSATVFLPAGVQLPQGNLNDIERVPLSNLDALIQRFAGAIEAVNMPDPQARRYQFESVLNDNLRDYSKGGRSREAWEANEPLMQFTALLEGVIFGALRIKLFDLKDYGFQSPTIGRRVLGVLVDRQGGVYGGTDPETLFFPAPEAWDTGGGVLRQLANENVTRRDAEAGRLARALLQEFKQTFTGNGGSRPVWVRAIEEYLQVYPAPTTTDEERRRAGWKHVGPVQLRLPGGRVEARYLPVYEADFVPRALYAISGDFIQRDDDLQLNVGGSEAGQVAYPQEIASGLTLRLMGAGAITVLTGAQTRLPAQTQINYEQLRDKCQSLFGDQESNASADEISRDPFRYPDVLRLPFQHDGVLAQYFLRGDRVDERYGERFLERVRGSGLLSLPKLPPNQPLPLSVRDGNDYYFVDSHEIFYVEKYGDIEVDDLSLLGQALWLIFCGKTRQVVDRKMFVESGASANTILDYSTRRLMPGEQVVIGPPDTMMNVADLRALLYQVRQQPGVPPLFKEAIECWLGRWGITNITPAHDVRESVWLGQGKQWWRPR